MGEVLLTPQDLKAILKAAVEAAGGAKKWSKKNGVSMDYALHMLANGDAATLPNVLRAIGYEPVTRYRKAAP
jgi:hypothetical protein